VSTIASYLEELARLLPRSSRRRILAEVDAHLAESAQRARDRGADADAAAREAVARFGAPAQVAREFNSLRHRPRTIAQRAVAALVATAATASLGTATVWALEPSHGGHSAAPRIIRVQAPQRHHHHEHAH
jgi:HAAS